MYDVFCTEHEGEMILHDTLNIPHEVQKKQCEMQSLDYIDPYHRVTLTDGFKTIYAAAVFFHDGTIWDAILSGYDTFKLFTNKRRLPKCFNLPYWRNL